MNDDDLVTLNEMSKQLGLSRATLSVMESRQRTRGAKYGFPEPVVVGRTTRLWSAKAIEAWWKRRKAGSTP